LSIGVQRGDPLIERLNAYRGWLLTNPLFLAELQQLKSRWTNAVTQLGHLPSYPVQVPDDIKHRRPRNGRDVTEVFVHDFNVASRARTLGIRSVPAVAIDGKLAGCCAGRGPDEATLRAGGLGVA
jgi:hypothetical protein